MTDTMKPCPFCGSAASMSAFVLGEASVTCDNRECNASGPMREDEAEAIAAWNRRDDMRAAELAMMIRRMAARIRTLAREGGGDRELADAGVALQRSMGFGLPMRAGDKQEAQSNG